MKEKEGLNISMHTNAYGGVLETYTSVRLKEKTKDRLEEVKNFDRESFDNVINRLVDSNKVDEISKDS